MPWCFVVTSVFSLIVCNCYYYLLPTAYCLLPGAYCLLPAAAYYLLPTACLLPTTYYHYRYRCDDYNTTLLLQLVPVIPILCIFHS